MKYSFEATNTLGEKFKVDMADSFDEAIRKVHKGINDRYVELGIDPKKKEEGSEISEEESKDFKDIVRKVTERKR